MNNSAYDLIFGKTNRWQPWSWKTCVTLFVYVFADYLLVQEDKVNGFVSIPISILENPEPQLIAEFIAEFY